MKRWLSLFLACLMAMSALSVLAEDQQAVQSGQAQVRTPGGFETPHYQFDYFIDGQLAYEIMVHAWTGKVLYTYGDLPGEGNG